MSATAVQREATMREPLSGMDLVWITLFLALATFMQVLDTTIANVSIPTIAGDLGVSANQGTWVITSFAVSNAIALPLTGWLARRFGEVRLFIISLSLFSLASLLCGLSPSFEMLVAARVLQGAAAGPMVPLSQSLLLANYPPFKRGLALSFWAMTTTVAPIMGPLLGGWITDNMSWPWIFYINIPVGILASLGVWRMLKDRETDIVKNPIDGVGLGLLVIGVGSLQYVLDKGNELDWFASTQILVFTIIAVVTLVYLVIWELTDRHPVIDLSLFRDRNFTIAVLAASIAYMLFLAGTVLFPLWLQTVLGYTASWAGVASAPVGVMAVILSPFVGHFLMRMNLRIVVSFSFLMFAFTYWMMSHFTTGVALGSLLLPRFLQGIGIATFFVPLTAIMLSQIDPRRTASAVGLASFLRIVGGSFGTSIAISLWEHRAALHHSQLAEHLLPGQPAFDETVSLWQALHVDDLAQWSLLERMVSREAFMLATNDLFWLMTITFIALVSIVWLAKPPFHRQGGKPAPVVAD